MLAFLVNIVFGIVRVCLIPWMAVFGTECYGILGAFQSVGIVVGTLLLSSITISDKKRHPIYMLCFLTFIICVGVASWSSSFIMIVGLFVLAYGNQYIFNSLQNAMLTIVTPDEMRGKVFCAIQALAMGFSALGNTMGGILM